MSLYKNIAERMFEVLDKHNIKSESQLENALTELEQIKNINSTKALECEVMTMKILNKNIDGLPEIGRKIAIYAAKHHEFMTVKRCDKIKILAKNWDNPEQHISSDGEFYSGDNGWIYPVDFDQYIYLDELISDRTKMREIDEAKMEEIQIKEVLDDFFITNRIPTGDELLFKQALYSVLIKEKRVGDSPEKFHELIFPFIITNAINKNL